MVQHGPRLGLWKYEAGAAVHFGGTGDDYDCTLRNPKGTSLVTHFRSAVTSVSQNRTNTINYYCNSIFILYYNS